MEQAVRGLLEVTEHSSLWSGYPGRVCSQAWETSHLVWPKRWTWGLPATHTVSVYPQGQVQVFPKRKALATHSFLKAFLNIEGKLGVLLIFYICGLSTYERKHLVIRTNLN